MRPILLAAFLVCSVSCLADTTFYVAPNGNDAWSGRLAAPNTQKTDGPWATLARSRAAIRTLKKAGTLVRGGVTVLVRAGTYELGTTFKLAAEDSGSETAPIVYRAYPGEKPVLTGGHKIGGFRPYKGAILQADVAAQGFAGIYFRQLYYNTVRQQLARYPNYDPINPHGGGFAYVEGTPVSMYQHLPDDQKRVIHCKACDMRSWTNPGEAEVNIFPRYNWVNNIIPVASVDWSKKEIVLAKDVQTPEHPAIRPLDRYYIRNLLEELDAPGEWYLEKTTGTLYFWPPGPLEGAGVYAPVVENLIEIGPDAAWITIRGFALECSEGSPVLVKRSQHCLIAGNTIRNAGGRLQESICGVVVDGGQDCGVAGNDIYDVSIGGIRLQGGDEKTLAPAGHYADNNYIHHIGVLSGHGCGIWLHGIGLRASHNLIHDTTRCGIFGGGCDCVVEYNHLRHTNLETEDTGAYYNGAAWHVRGLVVRYNYIHDVLGYGRKGDKWVSPYFCWGIYLDDDLSGTHVYGNIVARTYLGGSHIHAGRDNLLENNIFVEGKMQQMQYSGHDPKSEVIPVHLKQFEKFQHNPAYAKYPEVPRIDPQTVWRMVGNKFLRNIIYYRNPDARLYQYSRNDYPDDNQADYNLVWHDGKIPWTRATAVGSEHGPNLIANPGFEDRSSDKLPASAAGLPGPWRWSLRPTEQAHAAVVDDVAHSGTRSLRVDPGPASNRAWWMNAARLQWPLVAHPGAAYRFTAWIRAEREGAVARLAAASFQANAHNWEANRILDCGPQWRQVELGLTLPAPGDPAYKPSMKDFDFRIDLAADSGAFWLDDVSLREAEPLDAWRAWQASGQDRHSLLADPLFVDAAHDDYRLRPDSPAWKLGFKPIPIDKIGPYADPLRTTWPVVEASGVREIPLPAETAAAAAR